MRTHRDLFCCARRLLGMLSIFFLASSAHAAMVTLSATNLGGAQWQLDYTVSSLTGDPEIDELTIFLDRNLFTSLSSALAPAGWDPLVVQPDPVLQADGFYDVLALGNGLSPGNTLGGFSLVATFAGLGTPSGESQIFEVVDPNTFDVLQSGSVTVSTVPLPLPLPLLLCGLLMAAGLSRMQPSRAA